MPPIAGCGRVIPGHVLADGLPSMNGTSGAGMAALNGDLAGGPGSTEPGGNGFR